MHLGDLGTYGVLFSVSECVWVALSWGTPKANDRLAYFPTSPQSSSFQGLRSRGKTVGPGSLLPQLGRNRMIRSSSLAPTQHFFPLSLALLYSCKVFLFFCAKDNFFEIYFIFTFKFLLFFVCMYMHMSIGTGRVQKYWIPGVRGVCEISYLSSGN